MSAFYPNHKLRLLKEKIIPGICSENSKGARLDQKFFLAFHENNPTEAKKIFEQIYDRNKLIPDNVFFRTMGALTFAEKDYDGAIHFLEKGLKVSKNDFEIMGIMANVYEGKGQTHKAVELYKHALEVNPSYFPALTDLSQYYCGTGQYEKALELINSAIESSNRDPYILSKKAQILSSMGMKDGAIRIFKEVLEIDPEDRDSLINMGNCFISKNDYGQAIKCYDKALEITPYYKDSLLMKVQALIGMNEFRKAKTLLDVCIKNNPKTVSKEEVRFLKKALLLREITWVMKFPFNFFWEHKVLAGLITFITLIGIDYSMAWKNWLWILNLFVD